MKKNAAFWLLNKNYWFTHFWIVSIISIIGLVYMGDATYSSAPPIADYKTKDGKTVISADEIKKGQRIFHFRGLMNYGSFWGDGAERGPDYTAEALHITALAMQSYYAEKTKSGSVTKNDRLSKWKFDLPEVVKGGIEARVAKELHSNRYNEETNTIILNDAQVSAVKYLKYYYNQVYTNSDFPEAMKPKGYITDPVEINNLTSFFFWGSWAAAANRPGETYSYTHNWPYDPIAGNNATGPVLGWSFISIGLLFAGIMLLLYVYGQIREMPGDPLKIDPKKQILTTYDLENNLVRPTQKKTYKFFVFATVLFVMQVFVGILSAMDFASPFANTIVEILPFTILRSYHILLQIYWFFMMWVGYTLFFLPRLSPVPKNQGVLIDILFAICLFIGVGGMIGIYFGQMGILTGDMAYWFGSQGWEFMELGRFFSFLMLFAFSMWIYLIYRGVKPWITKKTFWSIPAWLLWGSGIMVFFLFFGLFATVDTNFAITDFWRWMVVHMWVEVTFEVFTTVIVGYILVQLRFVTKAMAEKVIYLAVILFLITATIGVAHNFYWISKPTSVIALGSVFSTLQVLPLLLLTFDAYKMRRDGKDAYNNHISGKQKHLMDGVWLFILAVNFWNIFGAGVLGSMINLPIINYYEHATYLTGNHAHAAMFGVKGNISIAGMLFVVQHLVDKKYWYPSIVKVSFWSLNLGIALMMFLDLFPAGLYQFMITLEDGLWFARTQEVINGNVFQTLTYFRSIGGTLFLLGTLTLAWFIFSRAFKLKKETGELDKELDWSQKENDWYKNSQQ
jgi:nitric oxide reductase subunit B